MKPVAKMLKAIYSQESKKVVRKKTKAVMEELKQMQLKEAVDKLEKGIEGTLTYMAFPYEHLLNIRTLVTMVLNATLLYDRKLNI